MESGLELEQIIGIDDEHIIGMRLGKIQCLVSIVSEVLPGTLMQLAGQKVENPSVEAVTAVQLDQQSAQDGVARRLSPGASRKRRVMINTKLCRRKRQFEAGNR